MSLSRSSSRILCWIFLALGMALILGSVAGGFLFGSRLGDVVVTEELLARLKAAPAGEEAPILSDVSRKLAAEHRSVQAVVLQAVPNEPPTIVATGEDSSGDEEPTHWPSPWPAVNEATISGRVEDLASFSGRHAGINYRHTLIPLDADGSRLLLVNTMAAAPGWSLTRLAFLGAGLFCVAAAWACKR